MNHYCSTCDEQAVTMAWETAGRGWKFLCATCYEYTSPIIQEYCEPYRAARYYPTYDYVTRTIK